MKSDKELNDKASEIIDSLSGFNLAEKLRVIESLHESLIETIEKSGGKIYRKEAKK